MSNNVINIEEWNGKRRLKVKSKESESDYDILKRTSKDIIRLYKKSHLEDTLNLFVKAETKEDVLAIVNEIGIKKRDFEVVDNKDFNKEKYIEKLITVENIPRLINAIGSKDFVLKLIAEETIKCLEIYKNKKNS